MPKPVTLHGAVGADGTPSKTLAASIARALVPYAERVAEVVIRPRKRSLSANAYYWGVVVRSVQECLVDAGFLMTSDDVHDWLKREHLPRRVVETPTGEMVTYGTTRTDSTTFADYIESVRTDFRLVHMGLVIPEPGERLTGRTIDEGDGRRLTFAAPGAATPEPEGDGLSDAGRIQAQLAEMF